MPGDSRRPVAERRGLFRGVPNSMGALDVGAESSSPLARWQPLACMQGTARHGDEGCGRSRRSEPDCLRLVRNGDGFAACGHLRAFSPHQVAGTSAERRTRGSRARCHWRGPPPAMTNRRNRPHFFLASLLLLATACGSPPTYSRLEKSGGGGLAGDARDGQTGGAGAIGTGGTSSGGVGVGGFASTGGTGGGHATGGAP